VRIVTRSDAHSATPRGEFPQVDGRVAPASDDGRLGLAAHPRPTATPPAGHGAADAGVGQGVDLAVDRDGDGRVDWVGHDHDRDGLIDEASVDHDNDGTLETRWVDENGNVHYGDRLPSAETQSSILNKQGVEVGRIEGVKSAEQLAAERAVEQHVRCHRCEQQGTMAR